MEDEKEGEKRNVDVHFVYGWELAYAGNKIDYGIKM